MLGLLYLVTESLTLPSKPVKILKEEIGGGNAQDLS